MSEMTDAPRPDLTAADWAAMRKLVDAAHAEVLNQSASYWRQLRANMDEAQFALLTASLQQWPLALDALARQQEANARLTAALAAAQFDRDEAIKDFRFGVHHDCRPNRKQAESWRDQLRDETDRHADTKAALADRDATIARLREAVLIMELATPMTDELAIKIDDLLAHIAMRDGFTLDGVARLLVECQRRMAADWVEIGRLRHPAPPAKEADREGV